MSPEMRKGREYDTRTDIWSLGVALLNVLFYCEEGFPNFEGGGEWAARRFAEKQELGSWELQEFVGFLFMKSSERPSATELLNVRFP
jgi:serine/threonine protein kinase